MRTLLAGVVTVGFAGLISSLLSTSCQGQFFQRSENRPATGKGPFSIFNGTGMSDSHLNRDQQRSGYRLFHQRGSSESMEVLNGMEESSQPGLFSGKGLGELPFYRGNSSSGEAGWNDSAVDNQEQRQPGFWSAWGSQNDQWRPARRYEMEERPRWLGRRPNWLSGGSEEPNWLERMNQRSRDFWSESSEWMQEQNQNMRTRRQETWDSWTRTWRPAAERPDFEPVPPGRNAFESPQGNGTPVDRF